MTRDKTKILQVPSPTDGSIRRLVSTLFEEAAISRVDVRIGILPLAMIEGVVEIDPEDEEAGPTENRSFNAVEAEIEAAFECTSDISVSVQLIEFHGSGGVFCTFERVRTIPIEVTNSNRISLVQYHPSPDYRVAEFYIHDDSVPEAMAFSRALSLFVRPAPGEDSGEGGPDGLNGVLSRMTAVTSGMMADLAKSQLVQQERMTALIEQQTEEFEAQKAKLNEIHEEQLDALNARNEELNSREAEMDNASTRSTRRKLRGAITDALKENQKAEIIPESARKVRTPILWLAGLGIVAPLLFSGWAFWQMSVIPDSISGAAQNWYLSSLLLRGSLGIFASVAVGLYLLRYLRNIESEAGRRALVLEQNLFDIVRPQMI